MKQLTTAAISLSICASASCFTLGDTYRMTPDQRAFYLIGLFEAWSSRPESVDCTGDPVEYIEAFGRYVRSLPADPTDPKRKMDAVPAALIAQFKFDEECGRRRKVKP